MPPVKPMLDEIELKLVQKIDTEAEQVQAQHGVPALEGDFLQGLGRRAASITLNGVMTGTEAAEDLKTLREKFRAAEPVSFVADIATATKVDQVLIEEMGVRELAGTPERFEYALTLRELVTPPPHETEEPPPVQPTQVPPIPSVEVGTLVVEVVVEGEPDFDFSTVRLTLQDNGAGGASRLLTNRTDGVWVEENLSPGSYTASAVVESPVAMAGEEQAAIRGGETTQITITLRPGVVIAKAFVVHFRFDSAFIEPCLRQVLRRVFDYAQDHPDEKLVIIGHTDLVGGADYNQNLSERRGRSAYAFLTFGTSPAHREAAIDEWDNLRVKPPATPLNDNWDRREYQYMLQDLGYYRGRIDEPFADDPEPPRFSNADSAIRGFQSDHALPVTGSVDGDTWRALVTEYLSLDALAVPDSQFLPNANESGCNGGLLKWLGFGEKDPVKNTEAAWRPNRRTEMLFVRTDKLPNAVEEPETFNLPEPGVVGTTWCLNAGTPAPPPSFLARGKSQPNKWLVVPAEPGKVTVSGVIKFADETRAANMKYVLIAPDGEFLREREDGTADPVAERPSGSKRGRGVPGRTDAEGNFSHPAQTPVGVYILQLPDLVNPSVARESNEPPTNAVGNIVCLRLAPGTTGSSNTVVAAAPASLGATIHPTPPAVPLVNPLIQMTTNAVVVRKSYTNPARVPVTLRTSSRFSRTGVLTRSSDAIRFFTAPQGGTEILFNNVDNVFPGGRLSDPAGVQLFAQARTKSASANDFQLTLTLAPSASPGAQPVGAPLTVTMTALELTLNIHQSPTTASPVPPPLPQPPDPPPAPGTATDKWFGGRVVNVQFGSSQERVMLSVAMEPADFTGELTLRQVKVAGTTVGVLDNAKLALFDNIEATPGESALANPFDFPASSVGLLGRRFGVQGKEPSTTLRDRGFQLGVKGVENDGDRVAFTVGVGAVIFTPADFVLVKKPHTNPRRMEISLFTTAAFNRRGTLTRSRDDIRFFRADGTEILFNNTDNVFEGAALTATVKIFAEGRVSSPTANEADRVRLTLTLDAGASPPAGTPATARLVSVELTLDVAVSRTSAAAPALLTEAEKITPGRFVQVNSPTFRHERAKLIVRPPKPVFSVGKIVLTPLDAAKVQLFADETPQNTQTPTALPLELDDFLIPAAGREFFIEGRDISRAARDAGFRLTLRGQTEEADRVNVTVVQVEVVNQPNNAVAAATFVRMGLWDRAFRFVAPPGPNTLFNDSLEANNFAGADSRKFHLRVRDAAARNAGHVNVNWRTLNAANNDLDNPANNFISLVETPANSGIFISRGLILAADNNDRDQRTHHGLPATIPQIPAATVPANDLRARGESNHRVRRASMLADMIAEYRPTAQSTLPVRLPVFERQPESRRRVPLQIFVLRDAPGAGSATAVTTAPGDLVWSRDLRVIRECYERIGMHVETVVAAGTPAADIVRDGTDSIVLIDPPAAVANPTNITFADEAAIGTAHPAVDTIRLFFVRNLASGNGGEAWSDAITSATDSKRATVFTIQTTGPLAAAHEIGHILSNKRVATSACDPTPAVRGHYCAPAAATRLLNDQNLMKVQFLGGEGVMAAKRIWDAADADGVNYFTAMRGSHYTRNF